MLLLIRGGSISHGYGLGTAYPDIIQEYYDKELIVINKSNYKDTSFDGIETYSADILPYKPDYLMLHFGIDDAYHPVYRSEFKENLVQIIRAARNDFNPQIFLLTSHSFLNQVYDDEVNIYYRVIREVAADLNCHLILKQAYMACFSLFCH